MLSNLFSKGTSEERFWEFFTKNREIIATIPEGNQDIAKELLRRLIKYNKQLSFEIGRAKNGTYEFVLSCNGVREEIPFANILFNAAPKIEGWNIFLFRRKKNISEPLTHEGLEMSHKDILMEYTLYKDEIHLRLYIRKYYQGDQRYKILVNKFLERALGEFDKMTKVGALEYVPMKEDMAGIDVISLTELQVIVHDNLR